MLKELKDKIRDMKATHVLIIGHFNEDANTNTIQEFMVEMRLYEVFS